MLKLIVRFSVSIISVSKLISYYLVLLCLGLTGMANAQQGQISGVIRSDQQPIEWASVGLKGTAIGGVTDAQGFYQISDIPYGDYTLIISLMGYETQQRKVSLTPATSPLYWDVELKPSISSLDQVVVTGTRTSKKITNSPIIVNVIDNALLESTQSVSLSEGLKFQPGLRVETDCQTCNYTQLRMNGLQGGVFTDIDQQPSHFQSSNRSLWHGTDSYQYD